MIDQDISFRTFGKSFQERILQALLSDETWAMQMMEVIRPEYFEKEYLRYLFELYADHYRNYKIFPSLQLLATMANDSLNKGSQKDEILCHQIVTYITHIRSNPNANDLPYIKDRSLNFCRNQALKEALEDAVDKAEEGRYEEIVNRVREAITVGTPNTTGHDFFEDFEARFTVEDRSIVPTGLEKLDTKDVMNGGLGRGEIGVVVAPTGVGKSHFLVQLGANALRLGKNVLHYTFELRENKVGIRYDSNLCNVPATDVLYEKQTIASKYNELRPNLGRLIIKEYPTTFATVNTLRSHIEKLTITKNFKPDVIMVDYADIMRSTRQYDTLRHELKLIYEELRGLAMELSIPIWTASQSNRDSTDADIVGLDKVSESFAKMMVCDFVVTLSRKPLAKANGLGNLFVAKSRLGKDGLLFPVMVDTSLSRISILDINMDLEEYQKTRNQSMKGLLKDTWKTVASERTVRLGEGAPLKVVGDIDGNV